MPRGRALSAIVGRSEGCEVCAPLSWHPRLRHGTDAERANWRLIGNGVNVHRPDLDEDIGVARVVLGKRARENEMSLAGWVKSQICNMEQFVFSPPVLTC